MSKASWGRILRRRMRMGGGEPPAPPPWLTELLELAETRMSHGELDVLHSLAEREDFDFNSGLAGEIISAARARTEAPPRERTVYVKVPSWRGPHDGQMDVEYLNVPYGSDRWIPDPCYARMHCEHGQELPEADHGMFGPLAAATRVQVAF